MPIQKSCKNASVVDVSVPDSGVIKRHVLTKPIYGTSIFQMKPRSKRQTVKLTLLTEQASTHTLTRGQSIHFEFVVFFHS